MQVRGRAATATERLPDFDDAPALDEIKTPKLVHVEEFSAR